MFEKFVATMCCFQIFGAARVFVGYCPDQDTMFPISGSLTLRTKTEDLPDLAGTARNLQRGVAFIPLSSSSSSCRCM